MLEDTIPADVCGFEIKVEFTFDTLHLTTFPAQEGQPLIQTVTGALMATLTNLNTGKSLDYNVSGPAKYTVLDDGSYILVGSRPWLLPDPSWPSSPPGYPALFYLTGHFVAQVEAAGNLVSFTSTGDIDDVCAALSG